LNQPRTENPRTANLQLLQLSDSLFPIGAYAHSDGLEAAAADGRIASADDLREWIAVCLGETIGRLEGPAVWQAWRAACDGDAPALHALDEELTALRPSSAARASSRAMGHRLLTTWSALRSDARLAAIPRPVALPIAFAAAAACAGVERRAAVEAYAYTRLAATVSAAMRLLPIGQIEALALLARALERVPAAADRIAAGGGALESFTPALDIAAMTQQYLPSRLFRT
jgi:urease accessory protein